MKSIELFAGIGGIALAAEWAGIETVAFCERDPFCQKVLNKHWPSVPIFNDICTLDKKALEERGVDVGAIELISGGFPCQPYSIAGKRKGKADDRDLWPEMFRVIEEIRPTWVVGENVANFANMELDRTLFDLENIGYKCQSFIIPAAAVGARHRRERIFIIAYSQSKQSPTNIKRENCNEEQGQLGRMGSKTNIFSNTSSIGLQGQREHFQPFNSKENKRGKASKSVNVCFYREWETEPDVGRVANGVPDGMDRLRGLGNAVVPQQIFPILYFIKQIRDMETQE